MNLSEYSTKLFNEDISKSFYRILFHITCITAPITLCVFLSPEIAFRWLPNVSYIYFFFEDFIRFIVHLVIFY